MTACLLNKKKTKTFTVAKLLTEFYKTSAVLKSSVLFCLLTLLPSLSFGGSPLAMETGRELIEKMSVAMQDLSYTGTFIYAHDGDVETMRIDHTKSGGVERERLLSLNGEAREIVRNAESVVCVWPGTKSVSVSEVSPRAPFPEFNAAQLARLESLYQFNRTGMDRVAGRKVEVVDIKPLDDYRYGYRLWIDAETFLLLRSVMSDVREMIIEQVMFTDIEYLDTLPTELFKTSLTGERQEWTLDSNKDSEPTLVKSEPDTEIPGVDAASIPEGFTRMSDKVIMLPGKSVVRRVMYTDGLASLSVYIASADSGQGSSGVSGMGAVHAFGAMRGDWHVTVVGEVPKTTVVALGESLALSK